MKKITVLLLTMIVIFSIIFTSCKKQETETRLRVSTTIFPLYDAVKNIAGDTIEVSLIIPANASPHTFEPTPKVMKDITDSKTVFMIGLGLELFMDKIKKQNQNISFIELGKKVNAQKFDFQLIEPDKTHSHSHHNKHDHNHGHSHAHGVDPHVWVDPINFIKIVEEINNELCKIFPEKSDIFKEKSKKYISKLNELDDLIKNTLKEVKNKSIVTFHDAFMYFAKRYGLKVVAVFEPWHGKEPSVQYRKKLSDAIKKYNVKAVFYEPQFNKAPMISLARETSVKTGELDPIGSPDSEGRRGYIELMKFNLNSLRNALID
jgi:zinc transport system substrate-binding protein